MQAHWYWLALGLILVIAETVGASGFLLALGMAAGATGIGILLFDFSLKWQLVWFALLSVSFAIAWWYIVKQQLIKNLAPETTLNQPLQAMVGRTTVLTMAIENGRGKIYMNDASWFVAGPELPVGTKVRIIGVKNNNLLLVEPDTI